jgi:hypothetical protein
MAVSLCLMPEPAAPFAVDPATAAHALVPAQPAAAMLGLRADPPSGNPRLALLLAALGESDETGAADTATESSDVYATALLAAGARAHPGS